VNRHVRATFTGGCFRANDRGSLGAPPREVTAAAVKKMVAENPDVIGYVTVTQMDDTIRAGTAVGRDSIVFWSIQNELAS
jgi:hypothetical protein